MEIRQVLPTGKALKVLEYLDSQLFPADDPYPKKNRYWWLAQGEGVVQAFAGLEIINQYTAFLCRAGVMSAHRGRGLHRHLIRVREKKARALGIEQVITYTASDNLRSANNLMECGYRLYRPLKPFGVPHALYFKKELV